VNDRGPTHSDVEAAANALWLQDRENSKKEMPSTYYWEEAQSAVVPQVALALACETNTTFVPVNDNKWPFSYMNGHVIIFHGALEGSIFSIKHRGSTLSFELCDIDDYDKMIQMIMDYIRNREVCVHIRWMIRRDIPEVMQIENESFEFPWFEEDFIRALRQRNCIGMVVEHDELVVGFMIYELYKDRLHILNLAVGKQWRRHGVGTSMVNKLVGKLSDQRDQRDQQVNKCGTNYTCVLAWSWTR
jgi:GNAT superfamily N-acetyltransferase